MEQSIFGMDLFAGFQFGIDPPGDIAYQNLHSQFPVAIDPRYRADQGEPIPWAFSVRVRIGPTYPGEQRAKIAFTAARSAYGPLPPILKIEDESLSAHPVGLF